MFKTILFALDGSEPSSGPARYATTLARDFACRVVVVHVNQLSIVTGASEHGPVIGALTGDTPQALLHLAPCPVLVASSLIRSDQREPIVA